MKMNKSPLSAVLLLVVWQSQTALADPADGAEEVAFDLDSLEEEPASPGGATDDGEDLLPVTGSMEEIERQPLLSVVSLIVLIPVAAMLLPPVRRSRSRSFKKKK